MTQLAGLLGAEELPIAADVDVDSLTWQAVKRAGGRADTPLVVRQAWPDERTLPLPLVIEGDDAPAIEAKVSAINRELAKVNTLILTTDDGLAGTFQTYPSDPLPPTAGTLYRHAGVYKGTANVKVEPFALGASDEIAEADAETPGALDLSAMTGEYLARLITELAPGASNAGTAMHAAFLALCPDETWDGYVIDAADVPGWDDVVADATLGVNVARFAPGAGADVGTVDTAGFPASAYLVLARVKDAGGELALSTPYTREVVDSADHYNWVVLGELTCPTRRVRGSAAANLSVSAEATTAAGYCHRLAFLPLRWGYLIVHDPESPTSTFSSLRAEWGDVYVDDVVDYEHVTGGGLRALGGQLIAIAEEAAGTLAHYHADLAAGYRPRRNWLA